jgi:hypothetical protein
MKIAPNTHNLEKRVAYCLALLAENRPNVEMSWDNVEIRMSNRFRRLAGRCKFWRALDKIVVEFSEALFASMTEMEKTGTVGHELAHAVCFRKPMLGNNHDAGWKSLCRDMGGDGDRLLMVKAPLVKNVVKRAVLADKDKGCALMVTTKMKAEKILCVSRSIVYLGSIAVNYNDKTYSWASVINPDVKAIKVLKESLGWKLIA